MKPLIFVILMLAITTLLLQVDDELNSVPIKWVESQNESLEQSSDAYIYLNGMMAPEGKDVFEYGKNKLSLVVNSNGKPEKETDVNELKAPSDQDGIYCRLSEDSCIDIILSNQPLWKNEIEKGSAFFTRYKRFLEFKEFTTMSKPSLEEDLPSYRYIATGNRVFLLKCLTLAQEGNAEGALLELIEDLKALRNQLSLADSILHKFVFAALISNDLDIISHISSNYNTKFSEQIDLLTNAEISMEAAFIREYTMIYNSFLQMDRHPEIFEMGGNIPGWLVRILYKPHMTMNIQYEYYQEVLDLSSLTQQNYADKVYVPKEFSIWDYQLRNVAGSALAGISQPPLHTYMARIFDLNCKIAITNYLLRGKTQGIQNPYYGDKRTVDYKENEICLEGPYKDEKRRRCVRI